MARRDCWVEQGSYVNSVDGAQQRGVAASLELGLGMNDAGITMGRSERSEGGDAEVVVAHVRSRLSLLLLALASLMLLRIIIWKL